jgi:ligand-binding sensor domain-containing protein
MTVLTTISELSEFQVMKILQQERDTFLVFTQDAGFSSLVLSDDMESYTFNPIDLNEDGILDNFQDGVLADDGTLWIATMGEGITRYQRNDSLIFSRIEHINNTKGLISDNIRYVFVDREGNIWFGSYGEGIFQYVHSNLSFYKFQESVDYHMAQAVTGDLEKIYVFENRNIILLDAASEIPQFIYNIKGIPAKGKINTAYLDSYGSLWIGLQNSGVFRADTSDMIFRPVFISDDVLARNINHITRSGNRIWISTMYGLYMVDIDTGEKRIFASNSGMPHNNIKQTYFAPDSNVYVATLCNEVYYINADLDIKTVDGSDFGSITSLIAILSDKSGEIWTATEGGGLLKLTEAGWDSYTKETGLFSNYCYSLSKINTQLIISHLGGISQLDLKTGIISTYNEKEGLKSATEIYQNATFQP